MIFLDTSVALAQLFGEDRRPPQSLWQQPLIASRLLEYELWNRVHSRGLARTHADDIADLLGRLAFVELAPTVLARAREPFPVGVRTLDALHLASLMFVRDNGRHVSLASYDRRLSAAAAKLGIDLLEL